MRFPPIEWADFVALGGSPSASLSDGEQIVSSPPAPKLVMKVLTAARAAGLPSMDEDRVAYAKALRDILLNETDYTQASDSPLSQVQREAWAAWREIVRGVPDADTGSGAIDWPSPPVVTASAVPESVTRWQLRTWLLRSLGVTPAAVSSLIGGIQDAATRAQAQIDWEDAPIVRRGHPLIDTLGGALGLTAAQIDQGFREAAALEQ
jgi:hypothetical protein